MVRNIFCCLVPGTGDQYARQEEGPVVIRPPPLPPSWAEPVIGPPAPADIGKKTLVLDLDETLVHSTLDGACSPPDFVFSVDVGGTRHEVAVRRRPHLATFLERVSRLYEVVVFTASQAVYAEQLLDLVDPARSLIRHRIFREACVQWEGNYLKDLTILGRDLAHTLIVDNSPQAFGFQLENGVPIESWYDDDDDDELLKLLPFLEAAAAAPDVRPLVREKFRLSELIAALPDPLAAMC